MTLVRHAVIPLLEAMGKLIRGRVPAVCEHNREYFRDVSDHLERIHAVLESLRETIATAIQVNLSMATSRVIRDHQAPGRLGCCIRCGDIDGRCLANELRKHARTQVDLMALSLVAAACTTVWWRFKRAGWL